MGLKALSISAVTKIKEALGDLAIDLTLRKRTKATYVPGSAQTYTNSDTAVKGVITKYRYDEIDGTMIQAQDVLIVLFPGANGAIPQPNDLVLNGSAEYRIMSNNPMYAGSEIAFSLVQGRPN